MSQTVSADGIRIGYETAGDGPAIVLVDGAMCYRGSGPMRAVAAALSGEYTAVLYDRRGRGASTDAPDSTVDDEIDDIRALVAAVGGSAALLGMSSGGALAALATARLGPAVTRLIVVEPPYMPEPARPAAAEYTRELRDALASGDRDRAVRAFLARVGVPAPAIEGMSHSPAWAGMTAIAPTLGYDDAVMADSAVPPAVAGITAPTLALAGGDSPEFMQWGARALADAIPGAVFRAVDAQGHDIDPVALAGALRDVAGRP